MPHVKVHIHFVWSTKDRVEHLKTPESREQLWMHIRRNALQKGIFIDTINGYNNHCHCLISLGIEQSIAKIIQLIKGESSYWMNHHFKGEKQQLNFEWQKEYFAASVSESMIDKVRKYIMNQEEHHKKKSYNEEIQEFLKLLNLEEKQ